MSEQPGNAEYRWLNSGDEIFPPMLEALDRAQKNIRLEVYTFAADDLGIRFRDKLAAAARRGVKVRVLLDAFGSIELRLAFLADLKAAGGEIKVFNPFWLKRLGFRDHRKMLVCDEEAGFIGGFNITRDYLGDGVKSGWCELGLQVSGEPVLALAQAFDEMFLQADSGHPQIGNRAHPETLGQISLPDGELLLGGPGLIGSPFKKVLAEDIAREREVDIIASYFLPTARIRRELLRLARSGGKVRLILPSKSDVGLSQVAAHSLYRRLLKAGVEIYEYQPQVLHTKLIIAGAAVYAGSSNLDPRSLLINYEIMLRITDPKTVAEARQLFGEKLKLSRRILLEEWLAQRNWWERFKGRWAHFMVSRLDPLVGRWYLGDNRFGE